MLTTDSFAKRTFATARRGDGYDVDEVDRFRDDVAEAITARDTVIERLRAELEARPVQVKVDTDLGDAESARRESSLAAARLLEMATVNADLLVNDAKVEADSARSAARAEAEQLLRSTHAEAERLTAELARREEHQVAELDRQRTAALAELASQRTDLEAQVEALRQLESEHRERLRRHFTEQLTRLDNTTDAPYQPAVAS